jgi:hypothetical protein
MKTAAGAGVVTLAVAVPALALTLTLFPPSPHMAPAPAQVPFFAVLAGINALALGLGVAFLAFGLPTMRRVLAPRGRAVAAYLAIAWLLVSWYPHGGLHASNGMDTRALLWIEYGFHVPLVIAPLVLIWALTSTRSRGPAAGRAASGTPGAVRDAGVPGHRRG